MYRTEMYRTEMNCSWTKSLVLKSLMFGSMGLAFWSAPDFSLAQILDSHSISKLPAMNSEQIFGQAVHQYFSGQYNEAVSDLTLAIDAGIEDPRLYYYRGLAHLQMGDTVSAETDFQAGADIEARYAGRRNFNIGRSLMRVQGETRMMIETARAQSRVKAVEQLNQGAPINRRAALAAMQNRAAAGQEVNASDAGTEVRPNLPDLSGVNDPTAPFSDQPNTIDSPNILPPLKAAQPTPAANDPFGQPAEETTPAANTQPVDDPFSEPAETPAQEPAGNDPFGEPGESPNLEPTDDPFSEPAETPAQDPAGNDPFAEPVEETPTETTPAADPFAEPAAGEKSDPFAEPASFEQPAETPEKSAAMPTNVRSSKVLSGLFGALAAPVKKAADAGANAVQNLGPGASPGGPGGPPPGFESGDDPFPPSGADDPFKN